MERYTAQEMMHLLDEQLHNAQKIQEKIIPKTETFDSSYYSFYSYLKPFRRVGGDFFDFQILDDDCVSFLLADATGHGIDAAMLTGMVKLIYSYSMREESIQKSPGKLLEQIDQEIEKLLGFSFFSSFSFLLDPNSKKIYWSNAGHPPAFLIKKDGTVIELTNNLPLIGMHSMINDIDYSDQVNDFGPGDKLILYTDGLPESQNISQKEYSLKRVKLLVEKYSNSSIETLCNVILNDNKEFTHGAEATDDICLLGIQFD